MTTRYPGHVGAQESRVKLLRKTGELAGLAEALVALAVARRAEGDGSGAAEAASEATEAGLSDELRSKLAQMGLVEGAPVESSAAAPAAEAPVDKAAPAETDGEVDLVIEFDESDAEETVAAPAPVPEAATAAVDLPAQPTESPAEAPAAEAAAPAPPAPAEEKPEPEVAEESAASPAETAEPPAEAAEAPAETSLLDPAEGSEFEVGDEDLRAIAEALESELVAPEADTAVSSGEDGEQAFEDVLSSFKERVAEVVSEDDHRTHYDLGVGYKEMGLVDEAIQQFEVAVASQELQRDACTMIAVCHRELERLEEAAAWYRKAIAAPADDSETRNELRYELGEVLLQAGDERAALDEFRGVSEEDPSFRDAGEKVSDLEARLDA